MHAGLTLRSDNFMYKHDRYNLKFVYRLFGEQESLTLKTWIDVIYKLLRASSQIQFLKRCRLNGVFRHI